MDAIWLLLPVLFPAVAGFAYYRWLYRARREGKIFLLAVTTLVSVAVWFLILHRPENSFTLYSFGKYYSIVFSLDSLGCFFAGMTSFLWPFATLYVFEYMEHGNHNRMFYLFYLLTYGVTEGICFSGNLLTLFVFYEMLTLSTLPLVLSRFNEDSQFAARRYALYCLGGSAFALIAVVFLLVYGKGAPFTPGGMDLEGLKGSRLDWVFLLGFFGFGVKAAIFPFHKWLPQASVAPTPVTALLHAVAVVKAGVFSVVRLVYYCIGPERLAGSVGQKIALAAACFTLVYGAAQAVRERHCKRRLAWSTVSNLSYILFGVLLCSAEGLTAGLCHMLFHAFIKIGAFMCVGAFMHKTGREYLFEVDGMGRRMPGTFGLYTVFALALTGIPLFSGFVSKLRLILAGFAEGGLWGILGAASLIVAAFLCAVYMLTPVVHACFYPENPRAAKLPAEKCDPTWRMLLPMTLFAAVTIFWGVAPGTILSVLEKVAGAAMGLL